MQERTENEGDELAASWRAQIQLESDDRQELMELAGFVDSFMA